MKSIDQIINQNPVFLGFWKEKNDVIYNFENYEFLSKEEQKKVMLDYSKNNILFAYYAVEYYDGEAFVIFERDGKLFEVNGSHCSCWGLVDQWKPQETTIEALNTRLKNGDLGVDWDDKENTFRNELCDFLGIETETKGYKLLSAI